MHEPRQAPEICYNAKASGRKAISKSNPIINSCVKKRKTQVKLSIQRQITVCFTNDQNRY